MLDIKKDIVKAIAILKRWRELKLSNVFKKDTDEKWLLGNFGFMIIPAALIFASFVIWWLGTQPQ